MSAVRSGERLVQGSRVLPKSHPASIKTVELVKTVRQRQQEYHRGAAPRDTHRLSLGLEIPLKTPVIKSDVK